MTEDKPTLTVGGADSIELSICAARTVKLLPDAYRLVTKDDGNGNTVYVLQGYFTWTQGWSQRGGEWRDLETQNWLHAKDDVPFSQLS